MLPVVITLTASCSSVNQASVPPTIISEISMTAAEANSIFRFMKHDPFVLGFRHRLMRRRKNGCHAVEVMSVKMGGGLAKTRGAAPPLLINLWRFLSKRLITKQRGE
jgi:hypothetical protein